MTEQMTDGNQTEGGSAAGAKPKPLIWETWLKQYDSTMFWLGIAGFVATIIFGFSTGLPGGAKDWSILGALVATFIALALILGAFSIGSVVGFLFGLPRTLTSSELRASREAMRDLAATAPGTTAGGGTGTAGAAPTGNVAGLPGTGGGAPTSSPPRERSAYTDVNTNLEQISDWLTKIIVGIGLTQLNTVPDRLDIFGRQVSGYFSAGGYAFGIGGGITALIYGFFFTYVGTRVRLSLVFTTSQRLNNESADGKDYGSEADQKTLNSASTDVAAPRNAQTIAQNQKVADVPLTSIQNDFQLATWADAQFQTGNRALAITTYREILKRRPGDGNLLAKLAAALAADGKQEEADALLKTIGVIASSEQASSAQRGVSVSQLRNRMQDGLYHREGLKAKDTLAAADELLRADPQQQDDLWFQIWLACAHGQEFARTKESSHRDMAVAAVQKALSLDPTQKDYLATLYDPARVKGADNDLTSLFPDPALDLLLLDKATPASGPEQ